MAGDVSGGTAPKRSKRRGFVAVTLSSAVLALGLVGWSAERATARPGWEGVPGCGSVQRIGPSDVPEQIYERVAGDTSLGQQPTARGLLVGYYYPYDSDGVERAGVVRVVDGRSVQEWDREWTRFPFSWSAPSAPNPGDPVPEQLLDCLRFG